MKIILFVAICLSAVDSCCSGYPDENWMSTSKLLKIWVKYHLSKQRSNSNLSNVFLWVLIIDCILIAYHYEVASSCDGRFLMSTRLRNKKYPFLFHGSHHDAAEVCDEYKECGCFDTMDGYDWNLHAGITTEKRSKGSDGLRSWVRRLITIS